MKKEKKQTADPIITADLKEREYYTPKAGFRKSEPVNRKKYKEIVLKVKNFSDDKQTFDLFAEKLPEYVRSFSLPDKTPSSFLKYGCMAGKYIIKSATISWDYDKKLKIENADIQVGFTDSCGLNSIRLCFALLDRYQNQTNVVEIPDIDVVFDSSLKFIMNVPVDESFLITIKMEEI